MNAGTEGVALSLVIPCYNESDRISLLYKGLESFAKEWKGTFDVVIVNDGSKDDTYTKLQEHSFYKANTDKITLVNQQNTGKGGALKNGVLHASNAFVLTLDADMATSPNEIINWLKAENGVLDTNTIYIGSREHHQSTIISETFKRKLAGNVFNIIVRVLTPLKVKDSQCGFKLYGKATAKKLFGALQTNGWAHDVEILTRAHYYGIRIKEMPITWQAIEGSKIQLIRDSIAMFKEILKVKSIIKNSK
ncbi:MAG: glycosyltransferase [Chitinophagales bacterium]|nr:glycosyltransferase [Chitinophagales bacterium]